MDDDPPTDAVLDALANPQRRIVLRQLVEAPSSELSVDALEAVVARRLEDPPPTVRTSSEVAIQLRHVHLPRLDDAGLCTYDANRECVAYRPNEFVESVLECIVEHRRRERPP